MTSSSDEARTLDEIMEGKAPGSVRVRGLGKLVCEWFEPHFKAKSSWYGLNEQGSAAVWADDTFCIVVPKTRTVKLYGVVIKDSPGEYFLGCNLYDSIESARKEHVPDRLVGLTDIPLATIEVAD